MKIWQIIIRIIHLLWQIRRFRPSVVISYHEDANFSHVFVLILRKITLPFLQTKHFVFVRNNPIAEHSSNTLFDRIAMWVMRNLFAWFDGVLVQTEANKKLMEGTFSNLSGKISVIQNPYDLDFHLKQSKKPLPPEAEEFFSSGRVILNIGRNAAQKGQWFLLRAFSEIVKTFPDARLCIIGEGPLRKKLEKLAKDLGISNKTLFLPFQENVFPFYRHAEYFVLPSLWEWMPNTLIEALSCGCPVIASDCLSWPAEILLQESPVDRESVKIPIAGIGWMLIPPFINDNGVSFAAKRIDISQEEEYLRDCMERILSDEGLRKNFSTKATERSLNFSIEVWAARIKSIFSE